MKSIKLSIVAALLATTAVVSNASASDVELSANVAMTSNYVWRGMTQSDNAPAIQGGFDASYGGLYAGVWGSNVDFNSDDNSIEVDLYAGYAGEISGLSYDLNYCQYAYPHDTKASNFGEASVTLGYDFKVASVSAKYYVGVDTDDLDPADGWEAGVSVPVGGITLDGTYGDYGSGDNEVGSYYYIGASKSFGKFDFTLAYTGMDYDAAGAEDEDNLIVTIGTSF